MGLVSIVVISILSILLFISMLGNRNLIKKQETSEDVLAKYLIYLDSISKTVELARTKMSNNVLRESFESDDEIGFFFKEIDEIQKILNEFILKEQNG